MSAIPEIVTHRGGCHCGRVRFEVDAPAEIEALDCNCSICRLSGFLHLIVPSSAFRLTTDEAALSEYRFGTGVARHLFCRDCGIKSFYVPRSNPDGIDVNVRALDRGSVRKLTVTPFDGEHWEQHADALRVLSDVGTRDG
ncbi:MAG TPA: GFA family protein [Patescibacteria group bacterium]|nr:GFA family protein [Patescibacteria group bacterium]